MTDIVERLRAASSSPGRDDMGIGEHWNLEDESADEIESLRRERDELAQQLAYSEQGKRSVSEQLATMTAERDRFKAGYAEACGEIDNLQTSLAGMTQEFAEYKADHITRNFRVVELVEQLDTMTVERDGWKTMQDTMYYQPLAASQAREQQLREALEWLLRQMPEPSLPGIYTDGYRKAKEALALPSDDTALKAWGAKLLRDAADSGVQDSSGTYRWYQPDDLRRMADELEGKK